MRPIVLIGDIVADVTLKTKTDPYKLRLGGITHAARGLWSLDVPYCVGYFSPEYLDDRIRDFLSHHGSKVNLKLGNIIGAPYIFLIEEPKESGNQGYEFLLRDEIKILYSDADIKGDFEDAILISGNYDINKVLSLLSKDTCIHIDLANNVDDLQYLKDLSKVASTIFISTSSNLFKKHFTDFSSFAELFRPFTSRLVLKENRGGSRGIDFLTDEVVEVHSQTQPIVHSVGVGDVYNVVYLNFYKTKPFKSALTISSWVASEYALTTFPDDFKVSVQRLLKVNVDELMELEGVFLPWEKRKEINVYVAAPDFDFVDATQIEILVDCLNYHNFSPRRPIKENGQMEATADSSRKKELFSKDMNLLEQCQILVAVLINNDPGTLVEIGLAVGMGMPAIVYDPNNIATNCMLSELPTLVTDSMDKVISEVFIQSSRIK